MVGREWRSWRFNDIIVGQRVLYRVVFSRSIGWYSFDKHWNVYFDHLKVTPYSFTFKITTVCVRKLCDRIYVI